jgi:uncharacterized Zn finger protein (UPF0148 family)
VSDGAHCRGIKPDGTPCDVIAQLSPEGYCLWHDPQRVTEAHAARSRGAEAANEQRRAKKIRAASSDQLPDRPLDDLDGVVQWLVWLARMTVTGQLDPSTSRETGKILATLKAALQVRDYARRLRELERQLAQYERARA